MAGGWLRVCALLVIGMSGSIALAQDKTAIVVGGGLAGLAAAVELQDKGWQVTVLEAKPSVGGRSGLATSEWIGKDKVQPVLNHYLDRFKLQTLPAPEFVRTPGYLIDGEYVSSADLAVKQPATAEAIKRYEKTLDDLARSIDDPLDPKATSTLFALDQITVSSWLDKLQLPATARQLINQQIRTRYDEPSRLSLLYFAQQARVYRGVDDRDLRASRLPGGSPVLAQAFVKQIKTLKTTSPVSSINQDKDGVTVKVGGVGYRADYVVMAVPLRALAKIQVTPGLDNQHMSAIKATNYGWRDQLLLKFKKPVWESRARMSGEIYSNAGLGMLWIEPALKGGANVVINLSGDNARLLQAFGDKQMVDQVLIRFHAFYPQARGAFSGYEVRRYSTDANTAGAYLAYGPGQISKYWRLWERPVQRIAFAGEHTDALYPGTLEGALRSGQRAASQVQDLAAGKSFDPVKAAPVAAAAAAGAAKASAAQGKGGFFSKLFGGWGTSSETPKTVQPTPAPAAPGKAADAQPEKPGFFKRLFHWGGTTPAPAPAPTPEPAPVVPETKVESPASAPAPAVQTPAPVVAAPKAASGKAAPSHVKTPAKTAPAKHAAPHKATPPATHKAPAKPTKHTPPSKGSPAPVN
ncbi:FAD-dependent oxidoreductase [Pseudomonas sp. 22-AL-CL-001]|uniref:flavin monoamine oxidase family protein n=1 Tax=Pseudomonas alabamensis TaxID=3064349 RepID=UPI002713E5F0|nr:FAD-dependent oxidoreductase [Pseudomonas sp. 22-AL-CL-001]MDO7910617.1 FAD-dependent oxidoreductase [Pseudomonas sp. 22-AL-CL-001]